MADKKDLLLVGLFGRGFVRLTSLNMSLILLQINRVLCTWHLVDWMGGMIGKTATCLCEIGRRSLLQIKEALHRHRVLHHQEQYQKICVFFTLWLLYGFLKNFLGKSLIVVLEWFLLLNSSHFES